MNAQQTTFKKEFLKRWKANLEFTLEVARKMPEEQYAFGPTDGVRSFGEQLVHIGEGMAYIGNSALAFEIVAPPSDTKDKDAVIAYLKKQYGALEGAVKEMDALFFEEAVSFWAGRMSRRNILDIVFDHCTHHRAQAIVHLRMKGLKPPEYRSW